MRIQFFSDLHIGVAPIKRITIGPDVDVVVIAGDVCEGVKKAFEHVRRIVPDRIPVVMVAGNHEFYRHVWSEEIAQAKSLARDFNLLFLNDDVTMLGDTRFVGSTLWTNYRLFGDANAAVAMETARRGMNDHRLITWQKNPWKRFRPEEALLLHERSRAFIADALRRPFKGNTVIVTHHAPHFGSVEKRFQKDTLTAAFASDLTDVIAVGETSADRDDDGDRKNGLIWNHGHTHASSDYYVGSVRILANPHGYGAENPAFDPQLVVEVGA
jgi:DNA repair exonuclease SbcCD nuclease subunit